MHKIVKRLHFCYGHRLMDYEGKCANAHGHNGTVEVALAEGGLDVRGMVCDFGEVKDRLMEFIEAELDHRMLLRRDDPLVKAFDAIGEKHFVMDENPTAENIAKLIFSKARALGLPVISVGFWETPSSYAEYSERVGG